MSPEAVARDTVDATAAALSHLCGPDRAAVELIYFHGCTQDEVAARLDMPPAEVCRRVARGLLALGDRLRGPVGPPPAGSARFSRSTKWSS